MSKKFNLVVSTYNTKRLRISLPELKHVTAPFDLYIHNDNPDAKVTEEEVINLCGIKPTAIINEPENQGLLMARFISIDNINPDNEWTLFLDDDDLITDFPDVSAVPENTVKVACHMLVIDTVADLLYFRDTHNWEELLQEHETLVSRGVSGALWRTSWLKKLRDKSRDFMPNIFQVFGTSVIIASESNVFGTLSLTYYQFLEIAGDYSVEEPTPTMLFNIVEHQRTTNGSNHSINISSSMNTVVLNRWNAYLTQTKE